jgi:hypothetical protein
MSVLHVLHCADKPDGSQMASASEHGTSNGSTKPGCQGQFNVLVSEV